MLGKEVVFVVDDNVVGENVKKVIEKMENGDVVLLENIRYRKEEIKNEENFFKELVLFVEIFVNDVFGIVYRVYCLIVGVGEFL